MPKTCNYIYKEEPPRQCTNPVFSHGFCKNHQSKTGRLSSSIKRTSPIRKISKKRNQILGEKRAQQLKDWEFFLSVWESREHVDYETNEPIYGEPLTLYFHHVLPKKLYPQFRYCKWNIVLVSWETHDKAERMIDLVPKIKQYKEELLKKYT